tara:strand:+ start:703 stop:870 length:168 start_codon:yes stop_codon:yes gene_type:complete
MAEGMEPKASGCELLSTKYIRVLETKKVIAKRYKEAANIALWSFIADTKSSSAVE